MNRDRLREIASLAQWSLGFFVAAAMLTYRELLPPGDPPALANVCGGIGQSVAGLLLGRFGFASYLIVLWLFAEGLRSFRRDATTSVWPRLPGWVLFTVALSAALSHVFPESSESIPDPGGAVGMALEGLLVRRSGLGAFGGRVALLFLLLTSFVLASGVLYSEAFARASQWWDGRGGGLGLLGFGRKSADTSEETVGSRAVGEVAVAAVTAADAGLVDDSQADEAWSESEWTDAASDDAEVEDAWDESEEVEVEDEAVVASDDPWDAGWEAGETDASTEVVADEETTDTAWEEEDDDVGDDLAASDEGDVEDEESAEDEGWESETEDDPWEVAADDAFGDDASDDEDEYDTDEEDDDVASEGTTSPAFEAGVAADFATAPPVGDVREPEVYPPISGLDADEPELAEAEMGDAGEVDDDPSWSETRDVEPTAPAVATRIVDDELGDDDEPPERYVFPPSSLLVERPPVDQEGLERSTHETARKLTAVLASFKIEARVVGVSRGPSIKMYEIELAPGTKLGRLRGLEDDLAMNLAAQSVRIVAPIPGRATAGIELPNEDREVVTLRELVESPRYQDSKYALPFFLGKGSAGQPLVADLAAMPHLLVAGATGAGKSVCLNTMIMSIVFKRPPEQVKMILIDPKMVELSLFKDIPHLMCPVVTDMKRAAGILEWAVEKMEARYHLLHEVGVRNIQAYNRLGPEKIRERLDQEDSNLEGHLPFIVIVIDELADLMMVAAKDVEQSITRLAQKSRAVGIHVILATQRPSTNVITGLIKANLPTRIAFRVASKIDSRVILDTNGAEKLLGAGDMLYLAPKAAEVSRVQGTFIDDEEINDVMTHVAAHSKPRYSKELMQKRSKTDQDPSEVDELFDDAARFVVETKRGSASLLQRRYQIGYTRASRLIDLMANEGYLGEYRGSQAREVLVTLEDLDSQRAEALAKRQAGKKGGSSGPTLYDSEGGG